MAKLDQCWKNQLRMSKWVAENWKPGDIVKEIKEKWLATHGFTRFIYNDCFFCEYMDLHRSETKFHSCDGCPGTLVNRRFHCMNKTYPFTKPKAFYREISRLHALYLKNKKRRTK